MYYPIEIRMADREQGKKVKSKDDIWWVYDVQQRLKSLKCVKKNEDKMKTNTYELIMARRSSDEPVWVAVVSGTVEMQMMSIFMHFPSSILRSMYEPADLSILDRPVQREATKETNGTSLFGNVRQFCKLRGHDTVSIQLIISDHDLFQRNA